MLAKNQKLTMVSIVFKGVTRTAFVIGTVHHDGKTTVPRSVIDEILTKSGCTARGLTYSIY